MEIVIKSQETREGVIFRILKDGKYHFANLNFKNYFYIKTTDFESVKLELWNTFKFCLADTEDVGQFTKIILSNNFMRNKVRDFFYNQGINTYEADIKANKRFMLDKKLTLNNEHIPYLFYDIETDDRKPMKKDDAGIVIADSRILSFSAIDNKGKEYYFKLNDDTNEDEIILIQNILNTFSEYGLITGWNSVMYDMPFIKQRCEKWGINFQILDYINHIDYMELYKKYTRKSLKSFSLNSVSNAELNESKIEQQKGNGAIYNTWKNDPKKLELYNRQDSALIYRINQKIMFIEVSMMRANTNGCHIQNTMQNSDSGDFLLMREFKKRKIIMPSKPTPKEVEERTKFGSIGGGHTTCFAPGFHEKVDIWDFKSEYPSVIQTWNISPETYVETCKVKPDVKDFLITPYDYEDNKPHYFRLYKKEQGTVPAVVKFLVEERDKTKYSMKKFKETDPEQYRRLYLLQYALKTDANSIYGVLSFPQSRYYSWELGDSVTTCSRATLKACYQKIRDWGCEVIGGDTDSSFVKLNGQNADDIDKKFVEFLDEWVKQWNITDHKLVFEHEKTFDTMLFVKKKHYAFKIKDEITIKGLEAVKSDSNPLAARLQSEFIKDILNKNYDENKWKAIVEEWHDKCFNQQLTAKDLLLVKALTKMPNDYVGDIIDKKTGKPKMKADGTIQKKAIPAHVKLAERMISKGADLFPGSKIKYIVVIGKPILALSEEEFNLKKGVYIHKSKKHGDVEYQFSGEYDAQYYWLRIIRPLAKVIACYIGKLPNWNWNLPNSEINKLQEDTDDDAQEE